MPVPGAVPAGQPGVPAAQAWAQDVTTRLQYLEQQNDAILACLTQIVGHLNKKSSLPTREAGDFLAGLMGIPKVKKKRGG